MKTTYPFYPFVPIPEKDKGCVLSNPGMQKLNDWVYEKMIRPLYTKDTYITTSVKLRIATGMLNKISGLSSMTKIILHNNLCKNIYELQNKLIDDDLPF